MSEQAIYGWLITVDAPDGSPPQVYNVAIREERLAVEAVKRVLRNPAGSAIKIKSKLTKQLFEALKMKEGDVLLGSRKKRPRPIAEAAAQKEASQPSASSQRQKKANTTS